MALESTNPKEATLAVAHDSGRTTGLMGRLAELASGTRQNLGMMGLAFVLPRGELPSIPAIPDFGDFTSEWIEDIGNSSPLGFGDDRSEILTVQAAGKSRLDVLLEKHEAKIDTLVTTIKWLTAIAMVLTAVTALVAHRAGAIYMQRLRFSEDAEKRRLLQGTYDLEDTIRGNEATIERLERETTRLRQEIDDIQSQIGTARQNERRAREDATRDRSRVEPLERELAALNRQIEELRRVNASVRQDAAAEAIRRAGDGSGLRMMRELLAGLQRQAGQFEERLGQYLRLDDEAPEQGAPILLSVNPDITEALEEARTQLARVAGYFDDATMGPIVDWLEEIGPILARGEIREADMRAQRMLGIAELLNLMVATAAANEDVPDEMPTEWRADPEVPGIARDFFDVLGIESVREWSEDFRRNVLMPAYRKLVQTCHPDKHPNDPNASAQFQLITTAKEALEDPDIFTRYIQFLFNPR